LAKRKANQEISFTMNCSPYFLFRKHYCKRCQGLLKRRVREEMPRLGTTEERSYICFFQCEDCGTAYEIKKLKEIEKAKRKGSDG